MYWTNFSASKHNANLWNIFQRWQNYVILGYIFSSKSSETTTRRFFCNNFQLESASNVIFVLVIEDVNLDVPLLSHRVLEIFVTLTMLHTNDDGWQPLELMAQGQTPPSGTSFRLKAVNRKWQRTVMRALRFTDWDGTFRMLASTWMMFTYSSPSVW